MYCENCGKNYANVRYTQIINGNKKEMFLCDECSKILGIDNFNMPKNFTVKNVAIGLSGNNGILLNIIEEYIENNKNIKL